MNEEIGSDSDAPAGWHNVTPRIIAHDAKGLVAFVCHVFAAGGEYDASAPTMVTLGDSKIMISDAGPRVPSMTLLHVYVRDADLVFRWALEHGAQVTRNRSIRLTETVAA